MNEIERMLRKQKCTINLGVEYKGEFYILNTLIIKGFDIYITPQGKFHASFSKALLTNKVLHHSIDQAQIPKEEESAKFSEKPLHISLHELKRVNIKSSGKEYLAPRGYTDLLNTTRVTDVYLFIPKNPFKNKVKQRHLNKNLHILKLPEDFDNTKNAIEYKIGIAPKNVDRAAVADYQGRYPLGTKINLHFFDLFLSIRIIISQRKGLHMVICREIPPQRTKKYN